MNAAQGVDSAPATSNRWWRASIPAAVRLAWTRLTWKHWAWATSIGLLVGLLVPLQILNYNFYWTPWKVVYHTPWFVAFAWVFLVAIAIAESSDLRPQRTSMWRYAAGAIGASVVCVGLAWFLADLYQLPPRKVVGGGMGITEKGYSQQHRKTSAVFALAFDGILHYWLATFIYVRLRNSRLAAHALSKAEIERSDANRNLLDSQLAAAHAVVDPESIFQKLDAIERIYGEDPARADALLDELIVFLRAAIPQLRSDEIGRGNLS
jgi:hypothetical protein